MTMVAHKSPYKPAPRISAKKIPKALVYEIMDGKPVYYHGYKEVLTGTKTIGEVMGASSLQVFMIQHLLRILFRGLDEKKYHILTNEAGLHINRRNNLSGDIVIYENSVFPVKAANKNYFAVPPKIQIEIDIDADVEDWGNENGYMHLKINKLLDFGVEKVIWITSFSKKVLVATKDENWQIIDWHKPIEILDGLTFNIGQYLQDEGSEFA
ncbi:MAG: Uma2 family endonuclease [Spirosomaceae bacterium]|jgi:hypothetical protein|nr:Uma2 family endonuclease [Spirosomataceae bacterium]